MKLRRLISAATLMSLLLVACGEQTAQGTPAPEEAVTVSFWHGQSGLLGTRLKELIDKFNASHKTQIKPDFVGDYPTLNKKVVAAIQAGSLPDMAQVAGPNETAQYQKARVLEAVQKFVDGPDGYSKDQLKDFYGALLDDNRLSVDGKSTLVSWPLSKSMQVLYYNPALLQRAGFSSPPKTWSELRTTLKAIKEKVPGVTPLIYSADFFYFFLPLLRANGGDVLSKNLDKAAFNTDAGREALQYQSDLLNVDKTAVKTKGFDWQAPFAQGKAVFAISTSVSRPFIEAAMKPDTKFEVGVAVLPKGDKKASNTLFGNNLVIFNKVPESHKRGAWLFMKWMSEVDQTSAWSLASGGGYVPLRQSAVNGTTLKDAYAKDPRLRVALDSVKDSQGIPPSPDIPKIIPIMTDAVTKSLEPGGKVKAALDEAERKVNDILKGE